MSTRGIYGFRKGKVDKLAYNHSDSYPSGLGAEMVDFCLNTPVSEMNKIFDQIILVSKTNTPTIEQQEECYKFFNYGVSSGKPDEWYCLLRNSQGSLDVYKEGLKYMLDEHDFIKDSLFCEYGYIINLDTKRLEFWKGFQCKPQKSNRYGVENIDGYFPCKRVISFDLNNLPENAIEIMNGKS